MFVSCIRVINEYLWLSWRKTVYELILNKLIMSCHYPSLSAETSSYTSPSALLQNTSLLSLVK